jgi:hypothetical protein
VKNSVVQNFLPASAHCQLNSIIACTKVNVQDTKLKIFGGSRSTIKLTPCQKYPAILWYNGHKLSDGHDSFIGTSRSRGDFISYHDIQIV